jgi:hypothetical protein
MVDTSVLTIRIRIMISSIEQEEKIKWPVDEMIS